MVGIGYAGPYGPYSYYAGNPWSYGYAYGPNGTFIRIHSKLHRVLSNSSNPNSQNNQMTTGILVNTNLVVNSTNSVPTNSILPYYPIAQPKPIGN